MPLSVDLNADLGEGAGHDEELLRWVSSASIACGVHAGDEAAMRAAIEAAKAAGVAVGAHPGLPDREHFGRREIAVTPSQIFDLVNAQLATFASAAVDAGVRPRHVKPHGALYNMATRDRELAEAVAGAVAAFDRRLVLFGLAGSQLVAAGRACGLKVAGEFFADRNYRADGSLVPRDQPGALVQNPALVAERVVFALHSGLVQVLDGTERLVTFETVCVHGDSTEAVAILRRLRGQLDAEGILVRAPG